MDHEASTDRAAAWWVTLAGCAVAALAACSDTGPGAADSGVVRPTWVGEPRTGERAAAGCPTGHAACPGGGCCPDGSQCNYYSLCRRDPDDCTGSDCCSPGWYFEPELSPSYCFGPRVAVPEGCSSDVPVMCGDLCCRVGSACAADGLCRLSTAATSACPPGSLACGSGCCLAGVPCVNDGASRPGCELSPGLGIDPLPATCLAGEVFVPGCCGMPGSCCPDMPGVHCDEHCLQCAVAGVQASPCPPEAPRLVDGLCCPDLTDMVVEGTCATWATSWPGCPPSAPEVQATGCCAGPATVSPSGEKCCGAGEASCDALPGGCCPPGGVCGSSAQSCWVDPLHYLACPDAAPTTCGELFSGALCCPPDTSCAGEHACSCPLDRPVPCGDDCLPENETCGGCPADHPTLCVASGECCLPGVECDVVEGCPCPSGTVACFGFLGDSCCPSDAHCINGLCMWCPDSAPVPCHSNCCPQVDGGGDAG